MTRPAIRSLRAWRDLGEAAVRLALARYRLQTTPAARLIGALRQPYLPPPGGSAGTQVRAEQMAWALAAAARRVPWRSDCFVQCLAADTWMRARGLRPEFHLGVAKTPDGHLKAHAWIKYGDAIVAGGSADGYEVLIAPEAE